MELLLERHPEFRGRFSFAQLAAPEPDQDRPLPGTERHSGSAGRPHQRAVRAGTDIGPSSCSAPTTSRPKCFVTIAPPTFAT